METSDEKTQMSASRTNSPLMISRECLLYNRQISNRDMMALGRRSSSKRHLLCLTQSLQLNRPYALLPF